MSMYGTVRTGRTLHFLTFAAEAGDTLERIIEGRTGATIFLDGSKRNL